MRNSEPSKKSKQLTWIEVEPSKKKPNSDPNQDQNRRVVQTEKGNKVAEAKPDAFLGWQNQEVERQTVNRKQTLGQDANTKTAKKSSKSTDQKSQNKEKTLSKLGIPMFKAYEEATPDGPDWATPGTRPEDYVQGMKESNRTALNTREYVFYSYFQRIRERLDRAWVPILRQRLMTYYRGGRHLAHDMDHTTRVLVVLNQRGEITRVQLVGESGTKDLDDAAVAAFNSAGPFPNPPTGMIDTNKEVKIPWDFILKT